MKIIPVAICVLGFLFAPRLEAQTLTLPVDITKAPTLENESCLRCHADKKLKPKTDRGKTLNLEVTDRDLAGTFHANLACVDCHSGAKTFEEAPHNGGEPLELRCAFCHEKVVAEYRGSVHGELNFKKDEEVPSCPDCHGRHNVFAVTDLRSSVNKFRLAETCGKCHRKGGVTEARHVHQVDPAKQFADSIHGKALLTFGLRVAPTCNDCHGAHDIKRHEDPESHIGKKNVPQTCGKCHALVEDDYEKSIHGELLAKGDDRGPTCIQCHSSHKIEAAERPEFRLGIDAKCGKCHADKLERYRETLHGKAIALGRSNVAACSDCHGRHNILQSKNPSSTIHPKNRLATCRQCHANATPKFAEYRVHASHTDRASSPQVYWTFVFMTALLIGTFAFFALHSLLWGLHSVVAFARNRNEFRGLKKASAQDKEQFVRFRPIDRFLHALVMFSFMLLVITGMPLKFYYTDWAKWILNLMQGQAVAAVLHRVGAFITIFYFTTHIIVVLVSSWRNRERFKDAASGKYTLRSVFGVILGPDSPMPTIQDFKDFWAHQKWFLGKGPQPQFDRWTYWEKFDYLAVFWGVGVIGLSGLIMWFPETFTRFLPGWMINIALVIHSDEALLAAGFIFTFHFFNVHFRLEKFPIDTVIFSGRISRTEMMHERGRQLTRWEKQGKLEEHRVEDEWQSWRKIAIPAGIMAFLLGVGLLVLIYSAMVTRLLHN